MCGVEGREERGWRWEVSGVEQGGVQAGGEDGLQVSKSETSQKQQRGSSQTPSRGVAHSWSNAARTAQSCLRAEAAAVEAVAAMRSGVSASLRSSFTSSSVIIAM